MDGLTNIIAKIHEQNDAECKAILENARVKADSIISEAKLDADKISKEESSVADNICDKINSKALSTADIEYKRAVLSTKSRILDETLKNAIEIIIKSPAEEYFEYIEKMILANALSGKGVVVFSQNDLARIPENFVSEINKKLCDGKSLEVSDKTSSFDGGFVIEYPEVRIDCSFASLLNDNLDDIKDELSRVLFD